MKKNFFIIPFLIILTGCVSLGKYEDLSKRATDLERQSAQMKQRSQVLENENARLRNGNDKLLSEISQLKKGAEFYFGMGMDSYRLENYDLALEQFEKVSDRYPTDPLALSANQKIVEIKGLSFANYQKAMKTLEGIRDSKAKADFLEKEMCDKYFTGSDLEKLLHKRDLYLSELKSHDDINKHLCIEDDPTQSTRFYRTTRLVTQHVGDDKSFYIEFYIAQNYSGRRNIRLKTRYTGNKWISYDSVVLKGEGIQIELICKYPDKLSNMNNERIHEWSDSDIDDEKVLKLSKSNSVSVRFNGGYKYTIFLDDEQLLNLREIVRKYQSLK
jgi:tetratricopeptide (TPR) repeat protein